MTPTEEQFESFRKHHPNATLTNLPSGAGVVTIPAVPLPQGWSQASTTVKFLVPVGYPFAKPDCFWVEPSVRLGNNALPQNANVQAIPETTDHWVWFSWHTSQWHPSRDNLLTYLNVIKTRLREAR